MNYKNITLTLLLLLSASAQILSVKKTATSKLYQAYKKNGVTGANQYAVHNIVDNWNSTSVALINELHDLPVDESHDRPVNVAFGILHAITIRIMAITADILVPKLKTKEKYWFVNSQHYRELVQICMKFRACGSKKIIHGGIKFTNDKAKEVKNILERLSKFPNPNQKALEPFRRLPCLKYLAFNNHFVAMLVRNASLLEPDLPQKVVTSSLE
jgi:hypothetical protein